jgi:hypothetical protein
VVHCLARPDSVPTWGPLDSSPSLRNPSLREESLGLVHVFRGGGRWLCSRRVLPGSDASVFFGGFAYRRSGSPLCTSLCPRHGSWGATFWSEARLPPPGRGSHGP